MSLTDQEILELTELCNALVDGRLTDVQRARLAEQLTASEPAREFYVRFLGLSASLHLYASEMQSESPDAVEVVPSRWRRRRWWALGSLAAAVVIGLTLGGVPWRDSDDTAEAEAEESVAQVTGVQDCRPSGGTPAWRPGDQLRHGQRLDLAGGLIEITFDCGAQVTLEGPATLDVNSAWDATLGQGSLKSHVPPEAMGFRIASPGVDVLDLGTEFSLVAAPGGTTDVYVLKGQVEATPRDAGGREQPAILLQEEQAHRFGRGRGTEIPDVKRNLARFSRSARLERFARPVGYVQWSFDEAAGRLLHAVSSRLPSNTYDAHLKSASDEALNGLRVPGRWQGALRLDGRVYAEAPLPELAVNAPRTVALWVRVAPDAAPAQAAAFLAWRLKTTNRREGWPVEIGWNPRSNQGTFGALRLECGRDCLVGTTPLRDGRWHHVAAVLLPRQRARGRPNVKLYVDGRLEHVPVTHAKKHPHETNAAADGNVICLGRRLESMPNRGKRFRGELDELLIADRALAPPEIKRLIRDNQPESPLKEAALPES